MIDPVRPRPLSLFIFVVVAAFAWGCRWMLPGFIWTPRAPDIAHSISILLGLGMVGGITLHLLRREGLTFKSIGLTLRRRHVAQGGFGVLMGAAVVGTVALVLTLTLSGRWNVGAAPWGFVGLSMLAYLLGSMLEELMFRGYLLPRLITWWGRGWALGVLALAFGLLHLPGLAGMEAVKMVGTTAACGFFYSALVLRTGSLWSAIGAHWAMNVVLHTVLGGTGKPALLRPEFSSQGPAGIDVGFWTLLVVAGGAAYLLLPKRSGAATPLVATTGEATVASIKP
jgi:membrane protease YdiL (CAAX protease family)